jgi:hypothetical protein
MIKVTVKYTEDGISYSDFEVENVLRGLPDNEATHKIETATENMLFAARTLHAEGSITVKEIYFNDQTLRIDKYGTLDTYPEGFHDSMERWLWRLLNVEQRINT